VIRDAELALAAGDASRAKSEAARCIADGDQTARPLVIVGLADAALGHVAAGIRALRAALAIEEAASTLAQLARLLSLAHQDANALDAAKRASSLVPQDAITLDNIGCVLARAGDHARAVELFRQAVAAEPESIALRLNLAASLVFTGEISEAAAQYELVLRFQPENGSAHLGIAGLPSGPSGMAHIKRIERAIGRQEASRERVQLHYAAAREYEDLGNYAASFAHLTRANTIVSAAASYRGDEDETVVAHLQKCFSEPGYFNGESEPSQAPLFVVGMPRTGTTLVDRILSSHPAIASAGELQALPIALKMRANILSPELLDIATIDALAGASPREIALDYLRRAAPFRPSGSPFVDKLPANFRNVGFIARALPNARIVCVRRGAMDSIWSNFKTLFAANSPYHRYAYDLTHVARYYVGFDRLMKFWHRIFPGRIVDIHYEAIVGDLPTASAALLARLDLPWCDQVLSFHENPASVATPSAVQVRRKIFQDSVGRWRSYAGVMEPAARLLHAAGISLD